MCPDDGNDALSSLPEASAAVCAAVPGNPVDQGRVGGRVGVGIGLGVWVTDGVGLGVGPVEGHLPFPCSSLSRVQSSVGDAVGVSDSVGPTVGVSDSVGPTVGVSDSVGPTVGVSDSVGPTVGVSDSVGVGVGVVGVTEGITTVGFDVGCSLDGTEWVAVAVAVGTAVAVAVAVAVADADDVADTVDVGVTDSVAVGVCVEACVGWTVGPTDGDVCDEVVGVGLIWIVGCTWSPVVISGAPERGGATRAPAATHAAATSQRLAFAIAYPPQAVASAFRRLLYLLRPHKSQPSPSF